MVEGKASKVKADENHGIGYQSEAFIVHDDWDSLEVSVSNVPNVQIEHKWDQVQDRNVGHSTNFDWNRKKNPWFSCLNYDFYLHLHLVLWCSGGWYKAGQIRVAKLETSKTAK